VAQVKTYTLEALTLLLALGLTIYVLWSAHGSNASHVLLD